MIVVLLTNNIVDGKATLETLLKDIKKQQEDIKIIEILVDNVPYETSFIAFPTSLEPIRASENMDLVWQGILENLKKLFPKPVIEPVPVPSPIPPAPPSKPVWKRYLPYILGIVALIVLGFFLFRNCSGQKAAIAKPEISEEKLKVEILDVGITTKIKTSKKCPEKIEGAAVIMTHGIGKVKGRWLRSDNTYESFEYNLKENEKGEIATTWKFGEPGNNYSKEWLQLEILEPIRILSEKAYFDLSCPSDVSFFMVVEDVFSISGRGTVATGKISKGTIKKGDQVYINNQGNPIICTGIEKFRRIIDSASEGENVGILLRGISKSDIKKGDKLVIR